MYSKGWSEPAATSAPIQDEAVQVVLGMNKKHILFPAQGFFSLLLCPKIFPSYLLSPPHTSFTSFPTHSISIARESSQAWVA
jgi:hypothetical protein